MLHILPSHKSCNNGRPRRLTYSFCAAAAAAPPLTQYLDQHIFLFAAFSFDSIHILNFCVYVEKIYSCSTTRTFYSDIHKIVILFFLWYRTFQHIFFRSRPCRRHRNSEMRERRARLAQRRNTASRSSRLYAFWLLLLHMKKNKYTRRKSMAMSVLDSRPSQQQDARGVHWLNCAARRVYFEFFFFVHFEFLPNNGDAFFFF